MKRGPPGRANGPPPKRPFPSGPMRTGSMGGRGSGSRGKNTIDLSGKWFYDLFNFENLDDCFLFLGPPSRERDSYPSPPSRREMMPSRRDDYIPREDYYYRDKYNFFCCGEVIICKLLLRVHFSRMIEGKNAVEDH